MHLHIILYTAHLIPASFDTLLPFASPNDTNSPINKISVYTVTSKLMSCLCSEIKAAILWSKHGISFRIGPGAEEAGWAGGSVALPASHKGDRMRTSAIEAHELGSIAGWQAIADMVQSSPMHGPILVHIIACKLAL